jgi:hypothetical protein
LTRHAFDIWLRTGRVPATRIEYKFNGWHDPDDGKFTEVGAGRYFPQGSSASRSGEQIAMARPPRSQPSGLGKAAAPLAAEVGVSAVRAQRAGAGKRLKSGARMSARPEALVSPSFRRRQQQNHKRPTRSGMAIRFRRSRNGRR